MTTEPGDTGDYAGVEVPLNLPSRTEEEERLVRFAYFAAMAAENWDRHPAAAALLEYGYDVGGVLHEMTRWFVEERQRMFPQFLGMKAPDPARWDYIPQTHCPSCGGAYAEADVLGTLHQCEAGDADSPSPPAPTS